MAPAGVATTTTTAELLVEQYKKVQRAADKAEASSGADVDRAVDGLKHLTKVKVTTELLVQTQLGRLVRKLAKHPSEKIAKAATALVEHWKQAVAQETSLDSPKSKSVGSSQASVKPPSPKIEKVRQNGLAANGHNKPSNTRPAQPARPSPLSKPAASGDPTRDKLRQLMAEALQLAEHEDECKGHDKHAVAAAIEQELWKRHGGTKDLKDYKAKYRSISFNMKDPINPDLRRRLLAEVISPEELMDMSAEDMASDAKKAENQSIRDKKLYDCQRGSIESTGATTDQFKCGKCGQRKCTYYQMQTRSADEPMTTYVTCVNCNNRWKFC
eukprot:jgi/Chlat1/7716/Chrsp66S07186